MLDIAPLTRNREEDVSKTMYKETLHASAPNKNLVSLEIEDDRGRSKVNRICDTFLKVLHVHTPTRYQNIITAHVCKLPPDLDAGLTEVARIQSEFSLKGLPTVRVLRQTRTESRGSRKNGGAYMLSC